MAIVLAAPTPPPWLKIGFYGDTGTGKTWTACKVMAQFIARFCPGKQLAMFDTEPSAGYVAPMVLKITGKPLLAVSSRSFSDLLDFSEQVLKAGHVAILDSATHPWRSLVADYLAAKQSRITSAGGRPDSARLSLKDWGPIKEMWGAFTEHYVYDPVHWCMCGREGDVWETVLDEEGKEEMQKSGTKMKTETETGYEPSLLVQMRVTNMQTVEGKSVLGSAVQHIAFVKKDRFDALTGATSGNNPDIEFFMPHIKLLGLGGKQDARSLGKPAFEATKGPNWETIKARREALLENIKDDLLLKFPGTTAAEKKAKVEALRAAFQTSSWTALQEDFKTYPEERLLSGRDALANILAGMPAPTTKGKDKEDAA